MTATETPAAMERDTALIAGIEALRRAASVRMGLAADLEAAARIISVPKVGILAPPADAPVLSGAVQTAASVDILARMMSSGQPHRAVPLTGALCLAVACRLPGTVAHDLVRPGEATDPVRVGHPSGAILVAAGVSSGPDGPRVSHATVFRTARRLFQGEVLHVVPRV